VGTQLWLIFVRVAETLFSKDLTRLFINQATSKLPCLGELGKVSLWPQPSVLAAKALEYTLHHQTAPKHIKCISLSRPNVDQMVNGHSVDFFSYRLRGKRVNGQHHAMCSDLQ
jgi:hypothetical protein